MNWKDWSWLLIYAFAAAIGWIGMKVLSVGHM